MCLDGVFSRGTLTRHSCVTIEIPSQCTSVLFNLTMAIINPLMSILLSCYKACFFSFFDQCLESIVCFIYSNHAALPHVVPLPVIKTLTNITLLLIYKSSLSDTQHVYIPYEYAK